MIINISIDTSPISRLVSRIGRGRMLAGMAVVLLAGASTYAYAISATPPHTFNVGEQISAGDMNANFSQLFTAVNAAETEIDALQDAAPFIYSCAWVTETTNGGKATSATASCDAANGFALTGSCSGSSLNSSKPVGITASMTGATTATGWQCGGISPVTARALCCPLPPE